MVTRTSWIAGGLLDGMAGLFSLTGELAGLRGVLARGLRLLGVEGGIFLGSKVPDNQALFSF